MGRPLRVQEGGARAGAARQLQPIRGGELMAEHESQPQETTAVGGEEGSGVGGGGQEHRDRASRRRGPKRRLERLSQLFLAQFLFLLQPPCQGVPFLVWRSSPGTTPTPPPLPAGSAPRQGLSLSSTLCSERPLGGVLPTPPPAVGAPWQCLLLQ